MGVADRLNKTLMGKYLLESFLGSGGMGLVYIASHRLTRERVAVKFLRAELANQPENTRRFINEAQAVARLKHPNAVRLMDLDIDPEYGLFMVLELLHGESLDAHLSRVERLSLAQTCEWLLPIMEVLERAHACDVLHRDVKPANIFLHREADGRITPKLLDFGLVRVLDAQPGLRTKTGQVLGTPTHMAPEQAEGQRDLGPTCDVWAMAVVWQRCLSGVEPFARSSLDATVLAIICGDYKPLPVVRPELPGAALLAEVLGRALEIEPAQRIQRMHEFAQQLMAARVQIEAGALPAPAPLATAERPALRAALVSGIALAAVVLAALGVYWVRRGAAPLAPPRAAASLAPESAKPALTSPAPSRPDVPSGAPQAGASVTHWPAPPPPAAAAEHVPSQPERARKPKRETASEFDLGEILVKPQR